MFLLTAEIDMKVAFISDVHGKWNAYEQICAQHEHTIQVGDFGIGFEKVVGRYSPILSNRHRFIRGNHDDPAGCKDHPNFIPDGHTEVISGTKVMFVGGAFSIDRHWRTEGINWWRDEENSYRDFLTFFETYEAFKPDLMVTHDCPTDFAKLFMLGAHKPLYDSTTGAALQTMFDIHQPNRWVFGHWHTHIDQIYKGTRFFCEDHTNNVQSGITILDL
jgi:hypothetical protein